MSYGDDMKDYQHDLEIQENYHQYMRNKRKNQNIIDDANAGSYDTK